jgi:peptide/nickel transport system substrate-binding protein
VIQAMTQEAGFDVKITAMEFASSLDNAERGAFQAYLLAWSGRVDADGNLWAFLHSGETQNVGHYNSPDMDHLLEQGRSQTDMAQRRATYAQIDALLQKAMPISYLYTGRNFVGMSAKIKGFRPVPDGLIRLQGLSMAQ